MHTNNLFILVFFTLFVTSCKKTIQEIDITIPVEDRSCPVSTLPEVTSAGKKKVACLVDGVPWESYKKQNYWDTVSGVSDITTDFYGPNKSLTIYSYRHVEDTCSVGLIRGLTVSLKYNNLEEIVDYNIRSFDPINYKPSNLVEDLPHEMIVHRFDRVNRIFSAEFSCTVRNDEDGTEMKIDSGRVDVKF